MQLFNRLPNMEFCHSVRRGQSKNKWDFCESETPKGEGVKTQIGFFFGVKKVKNESCFEGVCGHLAYSGF